MDEATQDEPPNIILILADDLGYGETGAYGQEIISTPNIDALASEGMRFTQHYTGAPVCAPARCILLTGKHAGHAYIRGNDEWDERGEVWDYRAMIEDSTLEGQRPIPSNTLLFPKLLQENGYRTGMVGKWGLGAPHTDAIPTRMGFDFFFGYNCQRQAHTYYPVHLYKNENRVYLDNDTIPPRTRLPDEADPSDEKSYASYNLRDYAPAMMFDEVQGFVKDNHERPFFLYWATPIPHNPIQTPKNWVSHYQEKLGEEEPYLGQKGYFPHQSPRAGYAGMISYLDENIGKLINQLKELDIYDNTIIIFTSDNGVTYTGGTDGEFFNSSGPFGEEYGRAKGYVYEGGIRIPMIVTWPGKVKAGSTSNLISAHYDIMPTLGEIVGFERPEGLDGISFLPTITGNGLQEEHEFLYWEYPEYGGQVAIRMGDYKLVRQHLKDDEKPTLELYDLRTDPEESNNIADSHPELVNQAAEIFEKEHQNAVVERFRIPLIETGLLTMP